MGKSGLLNMKEPVESREGKLTLIALLLMLYVIAMFFSIAIHEILGHGLFTVLLGGEFYAVFVSPGNGFASLWFAEGMKAGDLALVYLAGIIMQLAIGSAILFFVFPRIKNFIVGLFTLMFCVSMLVFSSLYLFMGYYYDGGDTFHAVRVLGIPPDAFLTLGIILTGMFIILITMAALKFMGGFMDLDDEDRGIKALAMFWLPPMLVNGISPLVYSLFLSGEEFAYGFLSALILLMFIGVALYLVPMFSESSKQVSYKIPMKSVFAVVLCFAILIAGWGGVFGFSRETAHGVMLQEPPIQTENYYRDYSIGNAEFMVYANGSVRADIILRNIMESPSPLESKIYHTFDTRPDWERYIDRSRYMLTTMFNLPRNVWENLTFTTDFDTVIASSTENEWGRKCTTWINLANRNTRQAYMTPGTQTPQPGMGILTDDIILEFIDPWQGTQGYLDEVRISWEPSLEVAEILAWNQKIPDIPYNTGDIDSHGIGWSNSDFENSPTTYKISFRVT